MMVLSIIVQFSKTHLLFMTGCSELCFDVDGHRQLTIVLIVFFYFNLFEWCQ